MSIPRPAAAWPLPTGRVYRTDLLTPCAEGLSRGDLWFSPFRDRVHAIRACHTCPFRGRCGYNAVAVRATYGVWGGVALPGDYPDRLEAVYRQLLEQFERRRPVELPNLPAPPMPDANQRRRDRSDAA